MARCIFCMTKTGPFSTREHVLPESLGGGDWAVLPDGLLCDSCQNKFGSEIEQQALGDYPFSFLRTFLGIPTKKGKAPWFESWEGIIRAFVRSSMKPGSLPSQVKRQGNGGISKGKEWIWCHAVALKESRLTNGLIM